MAESNLALLDTDVFGSVYVTPDRAAKRGLPVTDWEAALTGVRVYISFQTRAEVLSGAFIDKWNDKRVQELRDLLNKFPTVGIDNQVLEAYAGLRAACRAQGHPLHDKVHNADRWIAASAIGKGLPLFAHDGVYANVPGLTRFEITRR